jgi:hypothetical protein
LGKGRQAGRGQIGPAPAKRCQGRAVGIRQITELAGSIAQIVAISEQRVAGSAALGGQHGEIAVDHRRVARVDRRRLLARPAHQSRAMASAAIMRA